MSHPDFGHFNNFSPLAFPGNRSKKYAVGFLSDFSEGFLGGFNIVISIVTESLYFIVYLLNLYWYKIIVRKIMKGKKETKLNGKTKKA